MSWNPDEYYQDAKVAAEYDRTRFASIPGRVFERLEKRTLLKCFSGVHTGRTIADAPCGTGRLASALLDAGYRVHGLDISKAMLRVAEHRLRAHQDAFSCEVVDVKKRQVGSPTYDAALCARVLMHFPLDQQIQFLRGVAALSRSVVVINHSLDSPYQRLRRHVKKLFGDRHTPARHPITNRDIAVLLEKSGLREVTRHRLLSPISEAIYIVAVRVDTVAGAIRPVPAS